MQSLQTGENKKVKALFAMFEDKIDTSINELYNYYYEYFIRRSSSFSNGLAKTYTWDETKKAAIENFRNKNVK